MNSIEGYSIRERLFTSAKSIIYRATRTSDDCPVILKVLNAEFPSTEHVAQLHREYRLTRQLMMDGVIEVLGLERYGTSVAIVLEDFGGESLARLFVGRPVELPRFLSLALRLADILGQVHRRHVIHKDINPSNIVWNPSTDVLKLIDFGISTELSREMPAVLSPSVLEGTLPYISPEATSRMNRPIDYRTDFYSLGVTLYELLTGKLPFSSSDPMELVHCHIARVPVPPHELLADVPTVISDIIMRLLSKRAEERYQSAFTLARDLRRCLSDLRATGQVSSFALGSGDVSEHLQLPQKLYGRQEELHTLLTTFERVATGRAELVLVAGYSGIGKSSLVHEVHKPIVKRRGYFISGKFDQFNRNIPYDSLIQALQDLVRQLLTEPAERVSQWKNKLLGNLGPNASLIIDVIPEVEFIVGPHPKVPELPLTEAQNRFNLVFERFVRTFAGPEHPLVVFLDDLQWADLPSLKLIERLMTDTETRHLLLIGAYRENEVGAAHPLVPTLAELGRAGARVSTISLGALTHEHCSEMLADVLGRSPAHLKPLVDICLRKTEGNPFFLGQFLLSLYHEGMIRFDGQAGQWLWDMDRIAHTPMTDNVVELMTTKIQKLPADAQGILRLAACIGNTFDLKTLAIVNMSSLRETADLLWAGLREGLILPQGNAYKFVEDRSVAASLVPDQREAQAPAALSARVLYRFLHDRVQQAAYALIPEAERREVHLRIGRLMRSGLSAAEQDEELFTITGHLNLGAELIGEQPERDALAALNLVAARKAQASAAHAAALSYLEAGISLLGPERWARCYSLALQFHTQAVEASFMSADFESMERHMAEVLTQARSPVDQCRAYEVKIQACMFQQRLQESVQTARQALALLGIEFPAQPGPDDVLAAIGRAKAAIGDRKVEELIELPPMTDPVKLAATRIFAITTSASYVADPALFRLIVLREIEIAATYGNTGTLAYGYSTYGSVLAGALGDMDYAYAFGKLALQILDRYQAREYIARTHFIWNMFIRHWKEHIREGFQGLKDVYRMGVEVGDIEFAGWGAHVRVTHALFMGQELAEVDRSARDWSRAIAQIKQQSALYYTMIAHQLTQNLRGLSADPCRLVGAVYDEERMLPIHIHAKDVVSLALFFGYKLQLCFLFGRYAEAIEHGAKAERYLGAMTSTTHNPNFVLFDTLSHLALCSGLAPEDRARAMSRIDVGVAKMKAWAGHAPMNYGAKHALLEAERHRILGQAERARAEYYRAIALARQHEYRNDEALATERFAVFLRERDEHEVARLFMAKARHLYHLWGAEAKVRELERSFPELLTLAAPVGGEAFAPLAVMSVTTSESSRTGQALDLVSVIKACQAISGEMVLTELLQSLVGIAVENAGARRGLLVLEGERPLVALAETSLKDARTVTLHENIDQVPAEFSRAIMRYVERTHEVVVLGDAALAEAFQADGYIRERRPKSLLCMPLLQHKNRVGILYLENELLANAFTPERCKVLELLAAQIIISLENAKLYDTLDARVKEQTHELSETLLRLRNTQKQLVLQEKLAALGSLTSGIAHEIKNPLNFVNNFAESAVALVADLREEFRRQADVPASEKASQVDQILDELATAATKIHEHGSRVDRIIRSMLDHARSSSGAPRKVDVNEFVREHVNLALVGHGSRPEAPKLAVLVEGEYDGSLGSQLITPEDIGRVILNLAQNALHELALKKRMHGESFTPKLSVKTQNLKEQFEIRIRDNGRGIPVALRSQIFTPFFTTKAPGEGTGLGLSISHEIVVQGHGGVMEFSSEEGEYSEFVVALPKRVSAK